MGVPGELYVGGAGVARGYLKPARADGGALRARSRSAGGRGCTAPAIWPAASPTATCEFLGPPRRAGEDPRLPHRARRDRGRSHGASGRRATAAIDRAKTAPGDRRLIAYVVPQRGRAPAATDPRAHPQARLPAFMVPAAFITVDGVPAHAERKARPGGSPATGGRRTTPRRVRGADPPRRNGGSPKIWQEVLGRGEGRRRRPVLPPRRSFTPRFAGWSPRCATRSPSSSRCAPSSSIPSWPSLAADVDARRALGMRSAPAVDRGTGVGAAVCLPLSFQQQQTLFLDDLSEERNLQCGVRFPRHGARSTARLGPRARGAHRASRGVAHHSSGSTADSAEQVVLEHWQVEVPVVDVTGTGEDVDRLLREYALRAFDLSQRLPAAHDALPPRPGRPRRALSDASRRLRRLGRRDLLP